MIVIATGNHGSPNWKLKKMIEPVPVNTDKDGSRVFADGVYRGRKFGEAQDSWRIVEGAEYQVREQYLDEPTEEEKRRGKLYFRLETSTLFKEKRNDVSRDEKGKAKRPESGKATGRDD